MMRPCLCVFLVSFCLCVCVVMFCLCISVVSFYVKVKGAKMLSLVHLSIFNVQFNDLRTNEVLIVYTRILGNVIMHDG